MAIRDKYDLEELGNEMEEFVFQELEKQLDAISDDDICKCHDCVLDMICLSLNQLEPRYRVSLMGTLYAKVESQELEEKIKHVVADVLMKVSQNPGH
ncbi:MAG: late competence development ComFB family protein [Spirochaetaceae bacterium]|nr:late competence development ComFB family protein [Spirochaetaceae bacterium]